MSLQNVGLWAAVAVIAFVAVLGLTRPDVTTKVVETIKEVGATAGPERFNPCESTNGVTKCFARTTLRVGTTTSCAFKTPAATSSLVSFGLTSTGGHQVAVAVTFTKGADMQASTTALSSSFALAANHKASFVASTTNADHLRLLDPNSWVQANVMGGVGTASTTGNCQATFEVL